MLAAGGFVVAVIVVLAWMVIGLGFLLVRALEARDRYRMHVSPRTLERLRRNPEEPIGPDDARRGQ